MWSNDTASLLKRKGMAKIASTATLRGRQFTIIMKAKLAWLLATSLFLLSCGGKGAGSDETQITILSTTDLHGNLLPLDYYTNKSDERGLAKVAAIVKQARMENPDLLLIDSGDTIQGTPLEYASRSNDESHEHSPLRCDGRRQS
jgi:hypothetical protein